MVALFPGGRRLKGLPRVDRDGTESTNLHVGQALGPVHPVPQ